MSEKTDWRSLGSFSGTSGKDIIGRLQTFENWRNNHVVHGRWGYHRVLQTAHYERRPRVRDENAHESSGVNLASQDYLGLSGHPMLLAAVGETLHKFGPHSAGSPCAAGSTTIGDELCDELSQLVAMKHVLLFPSGWAAGFGAVQALVGRSDHILIDELSHACLQTGAAASGTAAITRIRHLDNDAVQAELRRIRASDAKNGILVITESLFSMDSDTPDLAGLQKICREHDATLLVDQAHDIGALGPRGRGHAAAQGMLGKLDLITGSFSKVFATNGGYLATNSGAVAQYLRYFASTYIFSSALSPIQTSIALAATRILVSDEGEARRKAVRDNAERLRAALGRQPGTAVLGDVSPIVPLHVDSLAVAREALGIAERDGVLVHLVEFPIVPRRQARYRLSVSSVHHGEDLDHAARVLVEAVREARSSDH